MRLPPFDSFDFSPHPLLYPVAAATLAVGAGFGVWAILRKRPSAAELEQRRRNVLANTGRIVDGTLIGVEPTEIEPVRVFYTYRVAGVSYECSQDVSAINSQLHRLRLDFPVQVRYSHQNPGNSIVIEESWNGLWNAVHDDAV